MGKKNFQPNWNFVFWIFAVSIFSEQQLSMKTELGAVFKLFPLIFVVLLAFKVKQDYSEMSSFMFSPSYMVF